MLTGGVVTIYVGPKRKEYQVHKGLLASCERWRIYLDAKLTEDSQTVHLPRHRADIWDPFVNWLYRGSLKDICVENEDMAKTQMRQNVNLYVQAELWAIPALQNWIMDNLRARPTSSWDWPTRKLIQRVYKYTHRDSPLRSYFVDSFLSKSSLWDAECEDGGTAARLKSQLDCGNQEFVLECYKALVQLTPKSKLRAPDRKMGCTYHKHEDGERCSK